MSQTVSLASRVQGLYCVEVTPGALVVAWSAPFGPAPAGYVVRYRAYDLTLYQSATSPWEQERAAIANAANPWIILPLTGPAGSTTNMYAGITGLARFKSYDVSVGVTDGTNLFWPATISPMLVATTI